MLNQIEKKAFIPVTNIKDIYFLEGHSEGTQVESKCCRYVQVTFLCQRVLNCVSSHIM